MPDEVVGSQPALSHKSPQVRKSVGSITLTLAAHIPPLAGIGSSALRRCSGGRTGCRRACRRNRGRAMRPPGSRTRCGGRRRRRSGRRGEPELLGLPPLRHSRLPHQCAGGKPPVCEELLQPASRDRPSSLRAPRQVVPGLCGQRGRVRRRRGRSRLCRSRGRSRLGHLRGWDNGWLRRDCRRRRGLHFRCAFDRRHPPIHN